MKKKVDGRIKTLVENCVKLRHRGLFVVIGDKAHEQVVNLHYLLSKCLETTRPSILWCYKTNLYLSSHKAKRQKQIKKLTNRGLLDSSKEDPFTIFVACTKIRYCYYHETHKILGNTFGMCVLQDFEALTPNLLAHTIETVVGGGLVVLLLSNLKSLTQLYHLTMDVHSRFKTETFSTVTGYFNERLVLSLASNPACLVMDDELNILPLSSHVKSIVPVELEEDGSLVEDPSREDQTRLQDTIQAHQDQTPMSALVHRCKTADQAKAVISFMEAATEKTLRNTVALTAARGRGKSAAMGLAISGAIALGYSNIFVTAPSPENLRTLFEFICKGLDALEYNEHTDYDLVASTNPVFAKAIIRINIFKHQRQTVQYILPEHHGQLGQTELLVIDEAAAIPLPTVRKMMGPYLVFLCSTVNGYEGTGRSLSLKLIKELREQTTGVKKSGKNRNLTEIQLQHPIRYAPGDEVESWLSQLLCLNCSDHSPSIPTKLPHPEECELFFVERQTLFSFHKSSEFFLQQMMALYVASHYKNSPNDLVLLSDAPAHRLFVLLGPIDPTKNALPDVLCVLQVNLEGGISKRLVQSTLGRGASPNGDLIPWTLGQQFQDLQFPSLSGARIVRIAVHPALMRAGYGTRALKVLEKYFDGGFLDPDKDHSTSKTPPTQEEGVYTESCLLKEKITPREGLPPLFTNLSDRRAEALDYLGTSFGLTLELYNFWHKSGYLPVYIRQTKSEVTGEFTVIMIKPLTQSEMKIPHWIHSYVQDFRRRFSSLLGGAFSEMDPALALTILNPKLHYKEEEDSAVGELKIYRSDNQLLDEYDLKRLKSYGNNLVDHHLILDLVPGLTRAYFAQEIPVSLSYGQAAILLCLGLQMKDIGYIEKAIDLPSNQVLALFSKAIRKILTCFKKKELPPSIIKRDLSQLYKDDEDVTETKDQLLHEEDAERMRVNPERLEQFRMNEKVETDTSGNIPRPGDIISIKRKAKSKDAVATKKHRKEKKKSN